MIGLIVYFCLIHFGVQNDRYDMPDMMTIMFWPVLFLMGVGDFFDWIKKERERKKRE